ncbi:MAG: Clp protease ClpP [Gammaproteobacteria bacterium]|nr:Clp protease ClpP [Gammaproteobacteria bacterium]
MKSWYSIENLSNGTASVSIHDVIGAWGVTAKDFISDLRQHNDKKSINLSIHTRGGDMIDGFAIYNALKEHPAKIHGHVEGVAASMGSVVLMACDTISMPVNAYLMIHNPSGGAMGGSDDLRKIADIMDKFKGAALNIYQQRTGLPEDELSEMLDAETWLDGSEAMAKGFVDTVTDAVDIAAKATGFQRYFKSMPINNNDGLDDINTIKDFERFLRDSGGVSKRVATALTSRAKVLFQGEPEIDGDAHYRELSALLDKMKIPDSLQRN